MPKTELTPPTILRTEDVRIDALRPDPNETARHSREQIELLARDIAANGLLQAIAVTEDGGVPFGHGRLAAVVLLNWPTIRANVYPKSLTDLQFRLIRASENLQRNELTPYRKWLLCAELKKLHGCDQKGLAALLNQSEASISKALSPSKTTEAWLAALKDGKVSLSETECASKLPLDQQDGLLVLKLASPGMNREQLGQAAKKVASPPVDAVKLSRVRLTLASKVNLVITGDGLSLDEVAEALTEAQREVRKAREQGIDVKAFNAVQSSKAKAV